MAQVFPAGLVDIPGGWDGSYKSRKRNGGANSGAPLGDGGTVHAGHVNWRTVVRPVAVTDTMGIAKPSAYVIQSLVSKPSQNPYKGSFRGYNKLPLLPVGLGNNDKKAPTNPDNDEGHRDGPDDKPKPKPDPNPPTEPTVDPAPEDEPVDVPMIEAPEDIGSAATQMSRKDSASYVPRIDSALLEEHKQALAELEDLNERLNQSNIQTFEARSKVQQLKREKAEMVNTLEYHLAQERKLYKEHQSEKKAFADQAKATTAALQDADLKNFELTQALHNQQKEEAQRLYATQQEKDSQAVVVGHLAKQNLVLKQQLEIQAQDFQNSMVLSKKTEERLEKALAFSREIMDEHRDNVGMLMEEGTRYDAMLQNQKLVIRQQSDEIQMLRESNRELYNQMDVGFRFAGELIHAMADLGHNSEAIPVLDSILDNIERIPLNLAGLVGYTLMLEQIPMVKEHATELLDRIQAHATNPTEPLDYEYAYYTLHGIITSVIDFLVLQEQNAPVPRAEFQPEPIPESRQIEYPTIIGDDDDTKPDIKPEKKPFIKKEKKPKKKKSLEYMVIDDDPKPSSSKRLPSPTHASLAPIAIGQKRTAIDPNKKKKKHNSTIIAEEYDDVQIVSSRPRRRPRPRLTIDTSVGHSKITKPTRKKHPHQVIKEAMIYK